PAPGSGNSTMTITVGASTAVGSYPITVTGNGGGVQQNTTVTLTVTAPPTFTISASPSTLSVVQGNQGTSTITTTISNGFNSPIALSASGMPSGTTVSFNPNPIAAPGSGNSTMTITVGASTPTGTYPITVTGNGGGVQQNTTVNLTVTALVALSWAASTSPGVIGYNAYRSMTSGGPYAKLNSSLISTTNYTDQQVQSGSTYYYVTTAVKSQGQESAYSNQAIATVPPAPPTFTISASPSTLSVVQGNQGTSTITTTISNGFNSSIALSASGLPSGTTVSFNPNPIAAPGAGNSTMTITVGASTPLGTYPITVTGNGGGVQQNTTVTLT